MGTAVREGCGAQPGVPIAVPVPFVVSLSRMRKVPLELPWHRSCRSASLRPILPKYHLPWGRAQRRGHRGTPAPALRHCPGPRGQQALGQVGLALSPSLLTLLPGWSPQGPRSCWGCSPWHPSSATSPPTSPPPWAGKQRTWRKRDRQTDRRAHRVPPHPHTAGPDPTVPHTSLLRPPRQSLGPGPSGGTRAQRHLPGLVCGCWGGSRSGGLTCC